MVRASLPEEVRQVADALLKLLETTPDVPTHIRTGIRVACAGSPRLSETRLTVALVGDAGVGRRTLVNALLGDRVLPTGTPRRGSTITIVRSAPTLEFSALSVAGRSVAKLSRNMPDRRGLFEKSMGQIDRETAATVALLARLQAARERAGSLEAAAGKRPDGERQDPDTARLDGVVERVAPLGSPRGAASVWSALWSWILRVLLQWPWVKRLAPKTSDPATRRGTSSDGGASEREETRAAIDALERELAGLRTVERLAEHAQLLQAERQKYEKERRALFLSQVREFDGTDIGERIVDYPARYVPQGLTLMDLPCPPGAGAPAFEKIRVRVARDVDALVVIADVAKPPSEATASLVRALSDLVPVPLVVLTKADGPLQLVAGEANDRVGTRLDRMRREALERAAAALGPSAGRAQCIAVAAEAALDEPPESSALADPFHTAIGALLERFESEAPVVIAWRDALRMRAGVAELSRVQSREEESSRRRLSRLESERIPDPEEFRRRLLDGLQGAIEEGADQVLAAAIESLRAAIEGLRSEWRERIASGTSRGELDSCITAIDASAAGRVAEALEQTAEFVARALHDATERLLAWAVQEIHAHYRLVRRLGEEALAPVASELTREDLERELLAGQPFDGAKAAFEKLRVSYGLGGVAAGAALGTLIAPGIGTAVGAVVGVLAGLLKGTDSLKQECLAKIDACLDEAESHAREQLQSKRGDLSRVIRVALDEAVEESLRQLDDAIRRLMTVERKAIERERTKLAKLGAARRAQEACDERLARIVERAAAGRDPASPYSTTKPQ